MMQKEVTHKGHLSQEERVEIYCFLREGLSYREIGRRIWRHHTVISRECRRNSIDKWRDVYEYKPLVAQEKCEERRIAANRLHIVLWKDERQRCKLEKLLKTKKYWWPDEILWRLSEECWEATISTATFYRFIRYEMPELQKYLRYKQQWYRTVKKWNKGKWKNKYKDVDNISKRCKSANERKRIWDWEWDTIISNREVKWGLVTLVDRKSRYLLMKKIGNHKANTVKLTVEALLDWEIVKTATFDNWIEFASMWKYSFKCYRTDPYSSWQRATNEKTNWFIRRFIPKWADINKWSDEEVQLIQNELNHKPRKILWYKTPYEVYHSKRLTYIT